MGKPEVPPGTMASNEKQVEYPANPAANSSNSNVQQQNSAIKLDDEHRKVSTDRIVRVDEAGGDNSAIIETKAILGALNGGNGASPPIVADRNDLSSSFLKNNESANADLKADGDKPAEASGIMWLSQAPAQAPEMVTKDGRESPYKSMSGTASTDRVPNVSQDNLAAQSITKQDMDSSRLD